MIDNYDQAMALLEKMKAHLPISIFPTPEPLERMENNGERYSKTQDFSIENVYYVGDMGGIICAIQPKKNSVYSVSLTHLRIPDSHELAEEIKDYQRKRVRGLALQQGKSGHAKRLVKRSCKKKGFG